MSRRTGRKRRSGRPHKAQAELDPLRDEALSLCQRTAADLAVLQQLLHIGPCPQAAAAAEQIRGRYEQDLQRCCELLGKLVEEADARNETLEKENRRLRQQNDQLTYQTAKLRLELQLALGVKAATGDEPAAKAGSASESTPERKAKGEGGGKRGAPKGHRGATRKVPDSVDREELIGPAERCSCGCTDITALPDFDVRYIEDIHPISREVLRLIYLQGRCGNCGKVVRHPDAMSSPLVSTGPNLAAHLTMLNQMGMTFRKLSTLSTNTLQIELSPSGVLGIVNRVAASLEGPYGQILEHLPEQDWLNGDETGWNVMGRNGYIWCFCNSKVAFFHHDFSRSSKVIEGILGHDFKGIVVCDFYAANNCIDATQRCLVHLLRDIRKEREIFSGNDMLKRFDRAVRDFIDRGLEVQAMGAGQEKDRAMAELEKQLDRLSRMKVTKGKAPTLVKRIRKYRDDLIRFVTHPGVEFHNNRAERQIRPIVVNRKVSFGSSTEHGARRYCLIHTIVETCKLHEIDPIDFIHRAYTSGGLDVPRLAGADPPAAA